MAQKHRIKRPGSIVELEVRGEQVTIRKWAYNRPYTEVTLTASEWQELQKANNAN